MERHYSRHEGSREQERSQNGQHWNRRDQDDDRDTRSGRGESYGGSEQGEGRRASAGGDFDREGYMSGEGNYGSESRGNVGQSRYGGEDRGRQYFGSGQSARGGQGYAGQGYGDSQGFSGGFPNEGYPGQGNFGGGRGFSNQGASAQRSQGSSGQSYGQGQTFGQGRGFAGRGPKGYQRSDERVKEQLSDRLMDDDDIDASEISIEVKNGEVTLSGTVNSREQKRAAEEIAEQSPGVREVQNLLRVSQGDSSGQANSTSGTRASGSREDSSKSQDGTSGQSKSR